MRKLFIRGLFVILCGAITVPVSAQSMSDAQVLEYVKGLDKLKLDYAFHNILYIQHNRYAYL